MTRKRISKQQKEIINNHFTAFINNTFTDITEKNYPFNSLAQLKEGLIAGKTSSVLFKRIVLDQCSITAQLLINSKHLSKQAKKDITNGFRSLLTHIGIE